MEDDRNKLSCIDGVSVLETEKIRTEFHRVLRGRRSDPSPLLIEHSEHGLIHVQQDETYHLSNEAMASCPKHDTDIPLQELLKREKFYLTTEVADQGRLPVLILRLKELKERLPAIVFLHSTHMCKEWLLPLLEAYASRGYAAIAIDSRYHGERANSRSAYTDALVSSWRNGDTMPFIFDTVWDLIKLVDYLTEREDIDPTRIGITGESLGGMHAWFAAFADPRYAVVVPIIGVQGFHWAVANDEWQGRVDSIRPVFEVAKEDLGKSEIDKEVVEKVWNRIAPGLISSFDCPNTIPGISQRPMLILNGAEDPRCPIGGLEIPVARARKAYDEANCLHKFKVVFEAGVGHMMTPSMVKEASDWFDKYLKH